MKRFEKSISLKFLIQCFFCVIIGKKKAEKAIQMHYNSEKMDQSIMASCSKLLALIAVQMFMLYF